MKQDIRKVNPVDISHLFSAGRKEGLLFVDGTLYAAIYENDQAYGYCGIKFRKNDVVFRNLWVAPSHRRRGFGEALIRYRKEWAASEGFIKGIAYCTPLSIGLHRKQGGIDMPHKRFHDVITFDLTGLS